MSCFTVLQITLENEERDRGWQEVGKQKSFLQSGFSPVLSKAEPRGSHGRGWGASLPSGRTLTCALCFCALREKRGNGTECFRQVGMEMVVWMSTDFSRPDPYLFLGLRPV